MYQARNSGRHPGILSDLLIVKYDNDQLRHFYSKILACDFYYVPHVRFRVPRPWTGKKLSVLPRISKSKMVLVMTFAWWLSQFQTKRRLKFRPS